MRMKERGLSHGAMVGIVVGIVAAIVVSATLVIFLTGGPQDLGDFKVQYVAVTNPAYSGYEQAFQQTAVFDQIAGVLNEGLALPHDITIIFGELGTVNAFYDPSNARILMGYELIAHFENLLTGYVETTEELATAVTSSTLFVFFHELGHALVDVYDLPITGKEEDAVDQLSILVLLEGDLDEMALNAAVCFYAAGQQTGTEGLPFWDVHSLDQQRFYNIITWIYGKYPQKYSYLVTQGILPEGRAQTAEYEYQQMYNSWTTLLAPYEK